MEVDDHFGATQVTGHVQTWDVVRYRGLVVLLEELPLVLLLYPLTLLVTVVVV